DNDESLTTWVESRLAPMRGVAPEDASATLQRYWQMLDVERRFLLTKLIGGGFRVGVSKLLVTRALADFTGVDAKSIALRLMGWTDKNAQPSAAAFAALIAPVPIASNDEQSRRTDGAPYPFFLAHALNDPVEKFGTLLGDPRDWIVEWKYDGIRAQLIKRGGFVWIWSRGEDLITERFPEIVSRAQSLPDGVVIDGEILVMRDGDDVPQPFNLLQQRIGRKTLSKRILADVPVQLLAYDLLELDGVDLREQPLSLRRERLEVLCASNRWPLSPTVNGMNWATLAQLRGESRQRRVEGFMLKARDSRYGSGRTKNDGTWWKWKVDPMSIDCVLIYAQAGHGRRAGLYTDYTFAVWNRAPHSADEAQSVVAAIKAGQPPGELQLVSFAKAHSGLTDEEFKRIDAVIRKSTVNSFGPVRSVAPSLVFELGFEGINLSPRHKSGIAVRFPRMLRIRDDKPIHEADTLDSLKALL
ncbi:MAG: ATP-dependent DNA ligase, partial [Casimicrobium sp.]